MRPRDPAPGPQASKESSSMIPNPATQPAAGSALRAGDRDTVAEIYAMHAEQLTRVMGRILLEREATLDCLHDLFVNLSDRLTTFDGRSKLSTWLHTTAVRMALDELRRRKRRRRLERMLC